MAYIVGYISKEEKKILEERGWEIEDAADYNLFGAPDKALLSPEYRVKREADGDVAVVIFVDSDVFKVMDGPDWDKGSMKCSWCEEAAVAKGEDGTYSCGITGADGSGGQGHDNPDVVYTHLYGGLNWKRLNREGAGHDMDRCSLHHTFQCPDCHPGPEDAEER